MAANTMECPQCHSPNVATAEFCVKCQTPFSFDGATMGVAPLSASTPAGAERHFRSPRLLQIPAPLPTLRSGCNLARGSVFGSTTRCWTPAAAGWSVPAQPASATLAGSPLQPGTVLGNRYEIISMLGQGGMGAVYKATDREVERAVALKVIRPELATPSRSFPRALQAGTDPRAPGYSPQRHPYFRSGRRRRNQVHHHGVHRGPGSPLAGRPKRANSLATKRAHLRTSLPGSGSAHTAKA